MNEFNDEDIALSHENVTSTCSAIYLKTIILVSIRPFYHLEYRYVVRK